MRFLWGDISFMNKVKCKQMELFVNKYMCK